MFCRSDNDTTFFFVVLSHYILDLYISQGTRGYTRAQIPRYTRRASEPNKHHAHGRPTILPHFLPTDNA